MFGVNVVRGGSWSHLWPCLFIQLAHDTLNGALGLEQWGIHVMVMKEDVYEDLGWLTLT